MIMVVKMETRVGFGIVAGVISRKETLWGQHALSDGEQHPG